MLQGRLAPMRQAGANFGLDLLRRRGFLFCVPESGLMDGFVCAALNATAIRLFGANFGPARANYVYRRQSRRFLLFLDILRRGLRIHCASTFGPRIEKPTAQSFSPALICEVLIAACVSGTL
jgi:hypothetical protein